MELKQIPKLQQKLVITPKLQLSLKLLQLNRQELNELIQQELLVNPFLEREETETEVTAPEQLVAETPNPGTERTGVKPVTDGQEEELKESDSQVLAYIASFDKVDMDWNEYYADAENAVYFAPTREEMEQSDFTQYTPVKATLYEHLHRQLQMLELKEKERELGEYIIGNLNNDGFLKASIEEIAEKFGTVPAEVEKVLKMIQKFDPPGIAARNLKECLRIQLEDRGETDPLVYQVVDEYFELLAGKKFDTVAKHLGTTKETVLKIYEKITHLDPRPARNFSTQPPQYINPDIIVEKNNGNYFVYLNEDEGSYLKINSYYRNLLLKKQLSNEELKFARNKYRAALWLLKNIERRRNTILRVAQAIIEMQKPFLDKGIEYLTPLTLRQVAEKVGMHESTVQRVTTQKYIQTPRGLYELKFFFSRGIDKDDGESMSSRGVKSRIQQLINSEDPSKPLSDQKIATLLKKEGINIARRTVAKYREQLGILPVKLRRAHSKQGSPFSEKSESQA